VRNEARSAAVGRKSIILAMTKKMQYQNQEIGDCIVVEQGMYNVT